MKSPNAMIAVFVVAPFVVLVGAWSLVSAAPYAAPADTPLLNGSASSAFESHFDEHFPLSDLGKNAWAAMQYTLLGEGQDGLVIGDDNWLFTEQEFSPAADAKANYTSNIEQIVAVRRLLHDEGIALQVALVPSKARLYPEHLNGRVPAAIHRHLYRQARQSLLAAGLFVPDVHAALARCKQSSHVFLRTDTHWTPDGATCAAGHLAGTAPTRQALAGTSPTAYETRVVGVDTHRGDLQNYLPLAPWFAVLQPAADTIRVLETTADDAVGDLFGAATKPPVALVGTSYSANEAWHFHDALRQALQRDVINLAEEGQGPITPMISLLDSGELLQLSPQLVIWEIPERYLIQPLSNQPPTTLVRDGMKPSCTTKEDQSCASL